jgi:hypothetical protein
MIGSSDSVSAPHRHQVFARLVLAVGLSALLAFATLGALAQDPIPASLSDAEFWRISEQLSETNGYFQSDNLVSNETTLSTVAADLATRVKPGGVYLGVGPEQNFTYITAIRPRIAFITDIRRGNLHMHLMYKALFELSSDRADFFGRLFSKPRPAGLNAQSSAADLMNAYWDAPFSDEATHHANFDAIKSLLVKKHRFPLSDDDVKGIESIYRAFYDNGPRITYGSSLTRIAPRGVTYADLMMSIDTVSGRERSFLSTEEGFAFLKSFESKNLLVPVVGDFAGTKALRGVGQYLKDHSGVVTAFYVSNVEDYLTRNGVWPAFCANVATLPLDEASLFIRPLPIRGLGTFTLMTVNGITVRDAVLLGGVVTHSETRAGGPPVGRGGTAQPFSSIAAEVTDCRK